MNFKVLSIFTFSYFLIGVLLGIPEGIWMGDTGQVITSKLYFWIKYFAYFFVDIVFFYFMFKKNIKLPILHAVLVVFLSWVLDTSLVYFLTGVSLLSFLTIFNFIITLLAIFTSAFITNQIKNMRINA